MTHRPLFAFATLAAATLLSACAGTMMAAPPKATFSQAALPAPVQVPPGHRVAMETVGTGEISYECPPRKSTGACGGSAVGRLAHGLPPQRAAQQREAARHDTSSGGPAADVTPSAATGAAVEPLRTHQRLQRPGIGRGG